MTDDWTAMVRTDVRRCGETHKSRIFSKAFESQTGKLTPQMFQMTMLLIMMGWDLGEH